MSDTDQLAQIDLTDCDREPIHVPGSIQPHGAILVIDERSGLVVRHAGACAALISQADPTGKTLTALFGDAAEAIAGAGRAETQRALFGVRTAIATVDLNCFASGRYLIVEAEPAADIAASALLLPQVEKAADAFEKAGTLTQLCKAAAHAFRRLCGYDRVMVYHFLEGGEGVVLAEEIGDGQQSFLNHHFPATDIPRQARQLYLRNLVRVIPDIGYVPDPLTPVLAGGEDLDLSDSVLRSVSPIHIQYMKNMGVGASASVSIVRDGALWGLIACHHSRPRHIDASVRVACRALAGALSRQIKAREDTDTYRERVRLRTFEDDIVALLSREGSLDDAVSNHLGEIMRMLDGDGVAVLRNDDLIIGGNCPGRETIERLARWIIAKDQAVYSTARLTSHTPLSEADAPLAAGLLSITLSRSEPWLVMWFRTEKVEVVKWAGNPHKDMSGPAGQLTPRASFDAWTETVRGRARQWSLPEIEAAGRLRVAVTNVWQNRRIQELNRELLATLDQKEMLLGQKEFLLREVNHRVQNSLQLVASFLSMQRKETENDEVSGAIDEARRRIAAVSLVHRRLYRSDQLEVIDAARYMDELLDDLVSSIGNDWSDQLMRDLEPVMIHTDKAVALGLVLTELVINANKYAYAGKAGPLNVKLADNGGSLRLSVSDEGVGRPATRKGFGSRMIDALVKQLEGRLDYLDNTPGTRAVLTIPVESGH